MNETEIEKLENELITLNRMFPNDSAFAGEVRKIVRKIQLKNIQVEKVKMKLHQLEYDNIKNK